MKEIWIARDRCGETIVFLDEPDYDKKNGKWNCEQEGCEYVLDICDRSMEIFLGDLDEEALEAGDCITVHCTLGKLWTGEV
jgi:hypothetical protein